MRADLLPVHSDFDVVKLVVNPPVTLSSPCLKNQFLVHASIQIALTLETIWNFRNQQVHQLKAANPIVALKALEFRIVEYVQSPLGESNDMVSKESFWRPPPPGIIKFNVNATILQSTAKIVVIARNDSGSLIKAWAKLIHTSNPLVIEASAIIWALQIAKVKGRCGIIVESDSKLCVDAIGLDKTDCDWNISTLCNDAIGLAAEFISCKFCWVKHEANMVAHTLAKLCTPQELPVIYFLNNLPTSLEEVWFTDFRCISLSG